ncbi:unnamed protein product [Lepeophtheirus salmonis]|uniref:(salmon louse) hypothetical protein n=1 Tax=Lepeophtheirus salmonis TaxID=72036 RepID=A0A7R8CSI7_LEPSM|nr:unnamed protein product [Lepeophtheirus salmonis]CAF2917196.1 unnamed protein product [Lepeophtheirus salmonis]
MSEISLDLRSTTSPSSARNGTIPSKSHPARIVRKRGRKNDKPNASINLAHIEHTTPDDDPLSTPHSNTLSDPDPAGSTTADAHTSTMQASSLASQPTAATVSPDALAFSPTCSVEPSTSTALPTKQPAGTHPYTSIHAQTGSSATITSNKTFHHWCHNWNASSRAQTVASFPRRQQIWTFLIALRMHGKHILEYSYMIDLESSDLTVNVVLENLHHYYRGKRYGGQSQIMQSLMRCTDHQVVGVRDNDTRVALQEDSTFPTLNRAIAICRAKESANRFSCKTSNTCSGNTKIQITWSI